MRDFIRENIDIEWVEYDVLLPIIRDNLDQTSLSLVETSFQVASDS